jgi:transcriptional regulator GlxA family with amidase domain
MDIDIVVYDGFDELDAIGPYEVFENAASAGADCETSLVTVEPTERVTASHGLRIEPDGVLADADPDLLVVPGGGWNDRSVAGAWTEAERGTIPDAVADLHESGTTVAGVCTGGMLLARAGILDGRLAVTHGGAMADLRETAAEAVEARVVDDGDVLTAGGVTSGLDLACYLVEREFGEAVAERVQGEMEYEPRGTVRRG